jgi:hypothetical protein
VIAVMRGANSTNEARRNDRPTAMHASIGSWLVTAALSLSLVAVALGGLTAAAVAVSGSLGMAHSACQTTEANLASDLGISVAALRATDPADLTNHITARQTTGTLTATGALQATDRASSYATCRQIFGQTATAERPINP